VSVSMASVSRMSGSPMPSAGASRNGTPSNGTASAARRRNAGVDGLKGVAIIAIVLYHLQVVGFAGGYLFVDVFFAVSGFLTVTGLLHHAADGSAHPVRTYYLRRLRRLYPTLLVVTLATVFAAWFLCRAALVGIGTQVAGALTFTYNWVALASDASYFANLTPEPLQHLWFVALLAQVLLVAPPLVALLRRIGRRTPKAPPVILAALALASALAMGILYDPANPTRAYFGTDTHCFGLLLGMAYGWSVATRTGPAPIAGAGAARPDQRLVHGRGAAQALAALALLGLVVGAVAVRDTGIAMRGGLVLAAGLAVLALRGCLDADGTVSRALGIRPLAFLGRHSYGIYLWHYPVFVIIASRMPGLDLAHPDARAAGLYAGTLALTAALCTASHHLFDRPVAQRGGVAGAFFARDVWIGRGAQVARASAGLGIVVCLALGSGLVVWNAPCMTPTQAILEADEILQTHASTMSSGVNAMGEARRSAKDAPSSIADAFDAQIDADAATEAQRQAALDAANAEQNQQAQQSQQSQQNPTQQSSTDAAPAPQQAAATAGMPTGAQMSMIGDSVMLSAMPSLMASFPGADIDAEVSRQFGKGPILAQQGVDNGTLRQWVVIGLSTNGTVSQAELDNLLRICGGSRVIVLVTGYAESRSWIDPDRQILTSFAAAHPDNVVLADWYAAISPQAGLLVDGVHPQGAAGEDLYVQTIRDSISAWLAAGHAAPAQ